MYDEVGRLCSETWRRLYDWTWHGGTFMIVARSKIFKFLEICIVKIYFFTNNLLVLLGSHL